MIFIWIKIIRLKIKNKMIKSIIIIVRLKIIHIVQFIKIKKIIIILQKITI
jgi:hypothetical protein